MTDTDATLLAQFVATFAVLDGTTFYSADVQPGAAELIDGDADERGFVHWRPRFLETSPAMLESLYEHLPARFPPLYEHLLLTYRWAAVDLKLLSLFANPPGPDLRTLAAAIFGDKALADVLLSNGLLQFGRAAGDHYDPICFDTGNRHRNGDCPIVRVDHEAVLCFDRLMIVGEVAPSFRNLMWEVIRRADQMRR